jgi:hypothetical protein
MKSSSSPRFASDNWMIGGMIRACGGGMMLASDLYSENYVFR